MTDIKSDQAARVLFVDDDAAMHDSYRRCFAAPRARQSLAPKARAVEHQGGSAIGPAAEDSCFAFTHATQGWDAVAAVQAAMAVGEPYAVAFIDLRMPPGIDGRETARLIRLADPDIGIVIVTGCSDFSPPAVSTVAGPPDKLFYIAKPFQAAEIVQTATALAERWRNDRAYAADQARLAARVEQLELRTVELAASESRALHIATHDSLTDAPNRLAFVRALGERVKRPGLFAQAIIDLDRFKSVNDTLGHLAGDALIREVCARLQAAAPADALIARLGGDEFGVLFDTPDEEAAVAACDRLIAAVSASVVVFGHSIQSGASAGLFVMEGDGRDPIDVVRRADLALYDAKRGGRGVTRLFDDSMDEGVRFRRRIEDGLAEAIARRELSLVYQPIVSRGPLAVEGFEALLRWDTPDYGPISPEVFIPIAEDANLIHELGDWVLRESLAELTRWPGQYLSVNFSPRQFRRQNFVGYVADSVARAGIEPARVQIEITETAIFDDADRAAETLQQLRRIGFRIALDDFGTGYSSLYNIRKFALDCLKIDRSFIDGMGRERESAAIVHSIIHLGRALGLGVIAEGVESAAQVQMLRLAGASHLQGFYFSHPVSPEVAREMAAARSVPFDGDEIGRDTGTFG